MTEAIWILAFIFLGEVHTTGMKLTEKECMETAELHVEFKPVCINTKYPLIRLYPTKRK